LVERPEAVWTLVARRRTNSFDPALLDAVMELRQGYAKFSTALSGTAPPRDTKQPGASANLKSLCDIARLAVR
jgi:hypothetical protein